MKGFCTMILRLFLSFVIGCMGFLSNLSAAAQLQYGNIIYIKHMNTGLYVTGTKMAHPQSPTDFGIACASEDKTYDEDTMWEIGPLSSKGQPVIAGGIVTLRSVEFDYYLAARQSLLDSATGQGALFGNANENDANNSWIWGSDTTKIEPIFFLKHLATQDQVTKAGWNVDWDGTKMRVTSTSLQSNWFVYEIVASDSDSMSTTEVVTVSAEEIQKTAIMEQPGPLVKYAAPPAQDRIQKAAVMKKPVQVAPSQVLPTLQQPTQIQMKKASQKTAVQSGIKPAVPVVRKSLPVQVPVDPLIQLKQPVKQPLKKVVQTTR